MAVFLCGDYCTMICWRIYKFCALFWFFYTFELSFFRNFLKILIVVVVQSIPVGNSKFSYKRQMIITQGIAPKFISIWVLIVLCFFNGGKGGGKGEFLIFLLPTRFPPGIKKYSLKQREDMTLMGIRFLGFYFILQCDVCLLFPYDLAKKDVYFKSNVHLNTSFCH